MGAILGAILARQIDKGYREEKQRINQWKEAHDVLPTIMQNAPEQFQESVLPIYLNLLSTKPTKFNAEKTYSAIKDAFDQYNQQRAEEASNYRQAQPPPTPNIRMVPRVGPPPSLGEGSPEFQQFMAQPQQEMPKPPMVPESYKPAASPNIPQIPMPPALENAGPEVTPQASLTPITVPPSMAHSGFFDPNRALMAHAQGMQEILGPGASPKEVMNAINKQYIGPRGNQASATPWVMENIGGVPVLVNKATGESKVAPITMPPTRSKPIEVAPGNSLVEMDENGKYKPVFTAPPKDVTEKEPTGEVGQYLAIQRIKSTKPPNSPEWKAADMAEKALRQRQANANEAAGVREDNRNDRVYNASSKVLENLYKPVTDTLTRVSRLEETLNQNNPVSDALVGPELLTVMAGGQGSGLRMNEAEISRIVNGRSNWETLKAHINKWKVDPQSATSILPAERKMIRDLTTAVRDKLDKKREVLDRGFDDLVSNMDRPNSLKSIPVDTRKKITAIDTAPTKAIIRVRRKSDGMTGSIEVTDFDPTKYEKIENAR